MTALIIQIITAILTATITLIALRKDLRSKTKSLKNEASIIRIAVIVLTIFLIGNSAYSYFKSVDDNKQLIKDKSDLTKSLTSIKIDNDSLRKQLTSTSIAQSKLIITSQEKSANDLKEAATNLKGIINGSDKIPLFNFVFVSDSLLGGRIRNLDTKPVFNYSLKITNYDNLLNCATLKAKMVFYDLDCYNKNTIEIPQQSSLNAKSNLRIDLPNFKRISKGRYLLLITIRNKTYYEQAIFTERNNNWEEALRIVELDGTKIIRTEVINSEDYTLKVVDWNKEFPLPPDFHLMKMRL